ncbi:hypothetical protein Rs2_21990 [Raphanus sativus]|nr:hypothetical protein Rs2_21990 [Raphanus sativus]
MAEGDTEVDRKHTVQDLPVLVTYHSASLHMLYQQLCLNLQAREREKERYSAEEVELRYEEKKKAEADPKNLLKKHYYFRLLPIASDSEIFFFVSIWPPLTCF